jgi:hypothetical protein
MLRFHGKNCFRKAKQFYVSLIHSLNSLPCRHANCLLFVLWTNRHETNIFKTKLYVFRKQLHERLLLRFARLNAELLAISKHSSGIPFSGQIDQEFL